VCVSSGSVCVFRECASVCVCVFRECVSVCVSSGRVCVCLQGVFIPFLLQVNSSDPSNVVWNTRDETKNNNDILVVNSVY